MKQKSLLIVFAIIAVISFAACTKNSPTNGGGTGGGITFSCTGITPKFSADVQPILTSVCSINSSCHATGSSNSGGSFTNFTEVSAKASNIRSAILAGTMPKSGAISQSQINAFICWIDSGAPNN